MPWIAPIMHPDKVRKGGWAFAPQQITYLTRVVEFTKGKRDAPPTNMEEPPPNTMLWPTLNDLQVFDRAVTGLGWDFLSVDIENAGQFITLVGITAMHLESRALGPTLSLPFKMRGGENYWHKWADHLTATEYLYKWLADPYLGMVFHNGLSHDIPILEGAGFEINGRVLDTMVMMHYCYPEMKKALQYGCTLYCWTPVWKHLMEESDDAEGKT